MDEDPDYNDSRPAQGEEHGELADLTNANIISRATCAELPSVTWPNNFPIFALHCDYLGVLFQVPACPAGRGTSAVSNS
jgi:hypothetical protein